MPTDPQLLHQRLLDLIGQLREHCEGSEPLLALNEALRAAVEHHKPQDRYRVPVGHGWRCFGCDLGPYPADNPDWPCSTIEVVAEELGVDVDAD